MRALGNPLDLLLLLPPLPRLWLQLKSWLQP